MLKLFRILIFLSVTSSMVWCAQVKKGEQYFFEYCASCHSLKYAPPGAFDAHPSPWRTSLRAQDARNWFGQVPPDLSLEAQRHSKAWIKAYLLGFYDDSFHRLGRNNYVFKDVAMPDVLYTLGAQRQQVVLEIVDFLEQMAYPEKKIRLLLGAGVMFICLLALLLAWQLKKSFKDC
jgi:ubiquinol-cytochrome c reductase cytochrome c1 subunit